MSYKINFTLQAKMDLLEVIDYIDNILKNHDASNHLINEFDKKVERIIDFPNSMPIIDDPALKDFNIHYVRVMNYLIFYIIKNKSVYIIRFLYNKADWNSILKEDM